MTRLTSDLRDDSSIHASGRRAVTAETSRARAGLRGGRDDQGIKTHPESLECRATGYIICLQEKCEEMPRAAEEEAQWVKCRKMVTRFPIYLADVT
ncbi:hypothetical protein NQZ68_042026 [Dissostichus eleginoides]|nr:hypothetical protein NQZ68_042026 [Dissostichus eleginoides]